MDIFKKTIPIILLIFGLVVSIWPLVNSLYFPMHDDTQPTRVYEMTQALGDGQFPVRWVSNLGYGHGYPIFNFYAPLPYYLGGALHLIGFDLLSATKLMFGIGMILAGVTMYFFAASVWGSFGGLIASLLYLLAPYHGIQLYVRGAIGELWAAAFLPLIFWSGLRLFKKSDAFGYLIGIIGLSGLILSHNISALLLAAVFINLVVVLFLLTVFQKKSWHWVWHYFFVFVLSLGLTAFFWLPAITESSLTKVGTLVGGSNDFRQHFVYLDQLWNSPWGYAGSAVGRADGMSFKLGKLQIIAAIAGIVLFFTSRKKNWSLILICGVGVLVSLFMLLPVSQVVWQFFPPLAFAQYPWRFLMFTLFFLALLGGGAITNFEKYLPKSIHVFAVIALAFFIVMQSIQYFQPQYLSSFQKEYYAGPQSITWNISKISDEYLPKDFPIPKSREEITVAKFIAPASITVKDQDFKSHIQRLTISATEASEILFSTAYFPGWEVFVDSKKVAPTIVDGKMQVSVEPGDHQITLVFTNTPIRLLANGISLVTLIGFLGLVVRIWPVHS